jgi:hypothetical protein
LTRRTFFEADIHDQKKEEEEKALLQAEERERETTRDCKEKLPQNKKLTKPVLKPMSSPRIEHRKTGSQSSLGPGLTVSSAGGLSPGLAHRSIGECMELICGKSTTMHPCNVHISPILRG